MIVTTRPKSKGRRKATIDNMRPGEVFSLSADPREGDHLYMVVGIAANVEGTERGADLYGADLYAVRIQGDGYVSSEPPPTLTCIIERYKRKEYVVLGRVTEIIYEEDS